MCWVFHNDYHVHKDGFVQDGHQILLCRKYHVVDTKAIPTWWNPRRLKLVSGKIRKKNEKRIVAFILWSNIFRQIAAIIAMISVL